MLSSLYKWERVFKSVAEQQYDSSFKEPLFSTFRFLFKPLESSIYSKLSSLKTTVDSISDRKRPS